MYIFDHLYIIIFTALLQPVPTVRRPENVRQALLQWKAAVKSSWSSWYFALLRTCDRNGQNRKWTCSSVRRMVLSYPLAGKLRLWTGNCVCLDYLIIWVLSGLLTIVNTSGMEIDSRSLGLERLRLRHVIHLIAGRKWITSVRPLQTTCGACIHCRLCCFYLWIPVRKWKYRGWGVTGFHLRTRWGKCWCADSPTFCRAVLSVWPCLTFAGQAWGQGDKRPTSKIVLQLGQSRAIKSLC